MNTERDSYSLRLLSNLLINKERQPSSLTPLPTNDTGRLNSDPNPLAPLRVENLMKRDEAEPSERAQKKLKTDGEEQCIKVTLPDGTTFYSL